MQRKQSPLAKKILTIPIWHPARAFLVAFFVMTAINVIHDRLDRSHSEDEGACLSPFADLQSCAAQIIDTGNIEGFSILSLGFLYLFESARRKKDSQYAAWRVIDQATGAKVPTSRARLMALEDLNRDQVSLKGIDLEKADLEEIDLRGAKLLKANMKQVILKSADLRGADLTDAKLDRADLSLATLREAILEVASLNNARLMGTDLIEARLSEATLTQANLSGANLTGAFLSRAILIEADFSGAELMNVSFNEADLKGANFSDADLKGAKFRNVRHLTPEQVREAQNWELANYDDWLNQELGLLSSSSTPTTSKS